MTTLIVAQDKKYGISKEGKIPWNMDVDRHYFHDVTTRTYASGKKNALIVGRKTWLAMQHMKLENRFFIVVSQTMQNSDQLYVQPTPEEAFQFATFLDDVGHIFICGGKKIYLYFVKHSDLLNQICITTIDFDYKCDNSFETSIIPQTFFHETSRIFTMEEEEKKLKVTFDTYTFEFHKLSRFPECNYLDVMYDLIQQYNQEGGRQTRNGKVSSLFGRMLKFNVRKRFPLLTTKQVFFRGIFEELQLFLRGETNSRILEEKNVKIWKENTKDTKGEMGPMYGHQWVRFDAPSSSSSNMEQRHPASFSSGVNQLEYCLNLLKTDPYSRRILMTSYNPKQASEGVLFPCHGIHIQFYVRDQEEGRTLSCLMTQRSADICCGVPFNVASYALLIHLFCNVLNNSLDYHGPMYQPGELIVMLADVHLYQPHVPLAMRQCLRIPYQFPRLKIKHNMTSLTDIQFKDVELTHYHCYPSLPYSMIA